MGDLTRFHVLIIPCVFHRTSTDFRLTAPKTYRKNTNLTFLHFLLSKFRSNFTQHSGCQHAFFGNSDFAWKSFILISKVAESNYFPSVERKTCWRSELYYFSWCWFKHSILFESEKENFLIIVLWPKFRSSYS